MKTNEIKLLTEKFFAGKTTLEEEHRLYIYFSGDDVDCELLPYKDMFCDIGELSLSDEAATNVELNVEKKKKVSLSQRVFYAVAAVVLLFVVGGTTALFVHQIEEHNLAQLYGGSYMIVNGERITDLTKIKGQVKRVIAEAQEIDKKAAADNFIDNTKREMLDNISDPDERREMYEIFYN